MTDIPGTLGYIIAQAMKKQNHSNRSLAAVAGVSDTAIRNLLKHGNSSDAKDPDAHTLKKVADALGVEPVRLFRLAGYIPPNDRLYSARAEYLAKIFDTLDTNQQEALLGIIETMVKDEELEAIQAIRDDTGNPLAGMDLSFPGAVRQIANQLITMYNMNAPSDVSHIQNDAQIMHFKWQDLPDSARIRIKALIQNKLALDYDPTMVDPEWRE